MSRSKVARSQIDLARQTPLRPVTAITRATEPGHLGMPQQGSVLTVPRLVVCLEGCAHYRLQQAGTPTTVRLTAGQALFVGAGSWVMATPRQAYDCLGIVLNADSLRFYRACPTRQPRWQVKAADVLFVPRSLPADGWSLCRMLEKAGRTPHFYRAAADALWAVAHDLLQEAPVDPAGKAAQTWQAARHFISDHLHQPLAREDVAAHLRIHPNHLSRLCGAFAKKPFAHYVQEQRLERADILLTDSRLNISDVAALSGFSSANYFIRIYRQRHGNTPGAKRDLA